jgi:hypothetical protein
MRHHENMTFFMEVVCFMCGRPCLTFVQIRPVCKVVRDVFLPSVYDALLVIRPSCNFRDGRLITNCTTI